MSKIIQIAYIIDTIYSDKGGTEKQLLHLIRRLDKKLFSITLICLYQSEWMKHNAVPCNVVILGYNGFLSKSFPLVMKRYIKIIEFINADIVQAFFEDSLIVSYLGKLFSKNKHVMIISRRDIGLGSDDSKYHFVYKIIRPHIFTRADGIATNAYAIKHHIMLNDNVSDKDIHVIANGIDIPTTPLAPAQLFNRYSADVWIGIVANLKPIKRLDLLLRAVAYLKSLGIKEVVRTVVLGEGRLRPELIQLASNLGVSDRIHFMDSVENVSDYLHGVDIGVLCSDKEGLSNAILEYMACGLPVVATDAGGNRELVDEMNGICVPTGDYIAVAQALAQLINSPYLRKELGACSLKRVIKSFTWERILPQWERYYKSLAWDYARGSSPPENPNAET